MRVLCPNSMLVSVVLNVLAIKAETEMELDLGLAAELATAELKLPSHNNIIT